MNSDGIERVVWGLAGFAAGAALVVFLEFLLLGGISGATGRSWMPRGLGWVVIPIAAGIAGAALGSRFRLRHVGVSLDQRPTVKLAVVGAVAWVVLVVGYVIVADPFGGYWDSDEWGALWRWLLIPPVLGGILAGIVWLAYRRRAGATPAAITPISDTSASSATADRIRATLEPLIANAKLLGAQNPRQAFDMTLRRQSTDEEWDRHRHHWELLWPYVKPLR